MPVPDSDVMRAISTFLSDDPPEGDEIPRYESAMQAALETLASHPCPYTIEAINAAAQQYVEAQGEMVWTDYPESTRSWIVNEFRLTVEAVYGKSALAAPLNSR